MVFAGRPNEIADRILHLHQLLGDARPASWGMQGF
jgi:hypothetical protein